MSDYLGNLLARSFAPMTAVRPELPSFFESVKTNVELATPRQAGISSETSASSLVQPATPLDFENAVAPDIPLFLHVKAHVSKRTPPVGEGIAENRVPLVPIEASEKAIHKKETDADSVADAIGRLSVSSANSNAGRPASGTGNAPMVVRDSSNLREAKPPRQVIPSATAPPTTPLVGAAPLTEREGETQGKVASRSAPTKIGHPKPDEVVKPVQPVGPRSEPVWPISPLLRELPAKLASSASTPAPSIQVTIGRLEVRAVPAPKAPRVQPAAAKTLSLDDYLRQRGSGGRR